MKKKFIQLHRKSFLYQFCLHTYNLIKKTNYWKYQDCSKLGFVSHDTLLWQKCDGQKRRPNKPRWGSPIGSHWTGQLAVNLRVPPERQDFWNTDTGWLIYINLCHLFSCPIYHSDQKNGVVFKCWFILGIQRDFSLKSE